MIPDNTEVGGQLNWTDAAKSAFTLVTQSEFGESIGKSQSVVSGLVASGDVVVWPGRGILLEPSKRLIEIGDALKAANGELAATKKQLAGAERRAESAERRAEKAEESVIRNRTPLNSIREIEAEKTQIELDQMKGALISLTAARAHAAEMAVALRDGTVAVLRDLAAQLAGRTMTESEIFNTVGEKLHGLYGRVYSSDSSFETDREGNEQEG